MPLEYTKHETVSLRKHPDFSEAWLHERICEDTTMLGLGELDVIDREPLTWSEMPERAVSYVSVKRSGWDSNNREDWGRQHRWFYDMLQLFHKAFSRAVKELRADDYVRDDEVGA